MVKTLSIRSVNTSSRISSSGEDYGIFLYLLVILSDELVNFIGNIRYKLNNKSTRLYIDNGGYYNYKRRAEKYIKLDNPDEKYGIIKFSDSYRGLKFRLSI